MKTTFLKGVALGSAVSLATLAATAAFAGTGVGSVFNLGQTNRVNARSQLEGSTPSAVLNVTNSDRSASASGLSIDVPGSNAPLVVNSSTKVKNLNADMVDGSHASDFQRSTSKSCPNGTAIRSIAPNGATTCSSAVVLPIHVTLPPSTDTAAAAPFPPSSLGINYECTSIGFAAALPENLGSAPATISFDDISDGQTPSTTNEVLAPQGNAVIMATPQTLSQIEYLDQTTVTTVDISVVELGVDGCEFQGTVEIVPRSS